MLLLALHAVECLCFWKQRPILVDQFTRPGDLVLDSLTCWLSLGPELQVLDPVVILHAVDVMNILMWKKFATQHLGHDLAVL